MTEKELISNELNVTFNYSKIDEDFDIYCISTSDKYIKGGAEFLDIDDIKISSIVFEKGNSFYAMIPKDTTSRSLFIKLLNSKDDGNSLSLKAVLSKDVPANIMAQLFLNALTSPTDKILSFNNLSGKLLCFRAEWLDKRKENMHCIEIKITKNLDIKIIAHRMSAVALKKWMNFGKRKFEEYPQYEFSYNNHTLRRVSKESRNRKENFIMKPVNNEKGFVTFFDFSDYKKFTCTKIGVLYEMLDVLNKEYGEYIDIKFKRYKIDDVLKCKRKKLESYIEIVANEIIKQGIHFVDEVKTSTSKDYLSDIVSKVKEIVPDAECSIGEELMKEKLNIRYIHDKSFYEAYDSDPHQDEMKDYAVQHITVENFKSDSDAVIKNILKELVIKNDLNIGKITLDDWNKLGFKNDWLFCVQSDEKYYFMTVHNDGTFTIDTAKLELFTESKYDKYIEQFSVNNDIIGLISDSDGNINLIKNTDLYSIPDFSFIGDILKNVAEDEKFTGSDLKVWMEDLENTTDNMNTSTILIDTIPKIDDAKEYSKAEIMGLLKPYKSRAAKKEIVNYVFQNTGKLIYSYMRGEEEKNEFLSGNIDINYIKESDNSALFSVGEIGNSMNYSIDRASVLRRIEAVEGSRLFFRDLLPLMGVEFVRNGMLTVLPFPFKYLREYILKDK